MRGRRKCGGGWGARPKPHAGCPGNSKLQRRRVRVSNPIPLIREGKNDSDCFFLRKSTLFSQLADAEPILEIEKIEKAWAISDSNGVLRGEGASCLGEHHLEGRRKQKILRGRLRRSGILSRSGIDYQTIWKVGGGGWRRGATWPGNRSRREALRGSRR